MAIIEGIHALYVAQVAGRHSMRMFTQVGRRVPLHSTGVGKALLCQLPDQEVRNILSVAGMPRGDRPHASPIRRHCIRELAAGRALGYVSEDGEQELGVSCVAVPVPGAPVLTAISFSGPAPRMTSDVVRRAATALQTRGRRRWPTGSPSAPPADRPRPPPAAARRRHRAARDCGGSVPADRAVAPVTRTPSADCADSTDRRRAGPPDDRPAVDRRPRQLTPANGNLPYRRAE